jgi:thioredoxin reductase (NADPH)
MEELVIIGSGPAGLTAAIYSARANLSPLVIAGNNIGGRAALTERIENYPCFPEGISGVELTKRMLEQAKRFGARVEMEGVIAVGLSTHPFDIVTHRGKLKAKSLIISTRASPEGVGCYRRGGIHGKGSPIAQHAMALFIKEVVVVGGGDAAVEEAIFLTKFASKVYLVHRRGRLRATKLLQERAFANEKMDFVWDSVITEVMGEGFVRGVCIKT